MQEGYEYVQAMVAAGAAAPLAQRAAELNLNAKDLAEIGFYTKQEVLDYFAASGVNLNLLNAEKTSQSLVADASGTVFLYDAAAGKGRPVFSFGTPILDLATDTNGDVYAVSAQGLLRFDFAHQQVQTVNVQTVGGVAQSFLGDTLVGAGADSKTVVTVARDGSPLHSYSVPDWDMTAHGDVLVLGNQLYATSARGMVRTDVVTGASEVFDTPLSVKINGLADGGDGWVFAYGASSVQAFNALTGEVRDLPSFGVNSGLNYTIVEGATEARQMQVDLWGLPG